MVHSCEVHFSFPDTVISALSLAIGHITCTRCRVTDSRIAPVIAVHRRVSLDTGPPCGVPSTRVCAQIVQQVVRHKLPRQPVSDPCSLHTLSILAGAAASACFGDLITVSLSFLVLVPPMHPYATQHGHLRNLLAHISRWLAVASATHGRHRPPPSRL